VPGELGSFSVLLGSGLDAPALSVVFVIQMFLCDVDDTDARRWLSGAL